MMLPQADTMIDFLSKSASAGALDALADATSISTSRIGYMGAHQFETKDQRVECWMRDAEFSKFASKLQKLRDAGQWQQIADMELEAIKWADQCRRDDVYDIGEPRAHEIYEHVATALINLKQCSRAIELLEHILVSAMQPLRMTDIDDSSAIQARVENRVKGNQNIALALTVAGRHEEALQRLRQAKEFTLVTMRGMQVCRSQKMQMFVVRHHCL